MGALLIAGLAMGLGGTIAMDIWALALNRLLGLPLPNWGDVGRWVAHLRHGTVFHSAISNAAPVPRETTIGWVFHYMVGLVYGVIFVMIAGASWLAAPTFFPAWVFAIVTIGAGWFLLHPGLGLGWALSKTPTPWKNRCFGLLAHTVFGIGLWVTALVI